MPVEEASDGSGHGRRLHAGHEPHEGFLVGLGAGDFALLAAFAAGAASVRDVGAGRFDPHVAATIAANVELAELQPARS